jgi:hypothetical protein
LNSIKFPSIFYNSIFYNLTILKLPKVNMKYELTNSDLELILDSLNYSKLKFEEYSHFPNLEFKKDRISEVTELIQKLKSLKVKKED